MRLHERIRRRAGSTFADAFFVNAARLGSYHPRARPERHHVERLRDIAYRDTGLAAHQLDIYRPTRGEGPFPVVLYVHGGGFRVLSKDSHWIMALVFASRGYLVFNINYRLAPQHPFPAACEDVAHAYRWVFDHARDYGGDPSRIIFAGESAGADLVTSLAVCACYERDEPWARRVWEGAHPPRAVLPACGMLQVSDPGRFVRRKKHLSRFLQDRFEEVYHEYLALAAPDISLELADPLLILERGDAPDRPLPPFFIPVGTRDPLLDDTRRLQRALEALGTRAEARYYPGGIHAFHAFVVQEQARRCWRHTFQFLEGI